MLRGAVQILERPVQLLVALDLAHDIARVGEHHGELVVEVVCDPPGQGTDGFHLLGLQQPLLALLVGCAAPAPAVVEEIESEEEEVSEIPPEGALPLSVILAKLEGMGYAPIVEAEFEEGAWEVEYVVDGEERELHVDPMTGEILPEQTEEPDDD